MKEKQKCSVHVVLIKSETTTNVAVSLFAFVRSEKLHLYISIQRFNDITHESRIVVGYNFSTRKRTSSYIYIRGASKAKPKLFFVS